MTDLVWEGADALRPFLVPLEELEPFPGNARLGNIPHLRASLRRFGQTRPILVDAGRPERIVAGHHIVKAALEENWTHIAAIPNEFSTANEASAYNLADNRLHDLGGYDDDLLLAQIYKLDAAGDGFAGTGFDPPGDGPFDDPPASNPPPPPVDLEEITLLVTRQQRQQLEAWLRIVSHERGTIGREETLLAAVRFAAEQLNR